ncbi:MAG: DUF4230 domain-containing protein, partial [Streptococcus gallolyticus]|nr:DUF4230 domain-containing protein [Streptococcus gallolyticus]
LTYDFKKIKIDPDKQNGTLWITLPDLIFNEPYLDDSVTLEFLPKDAKVDINEARRACIEDAKSETNNIKNLQEIAKSNTKKAVKAMLDPYLASNNLKLRWTDES